MKTLGEKYRSRAMVLFLVAFSIGMAARLLDFVILGSQSTAKSLGLWLPGFTILSMSTIVPFLLILGFYALYRSKTVAAEENIDQRKIGRPGILLLFLVLGYLIFWLLSHIPSW